MSAAALADNFLDRSGTDSGQMHRILAVDNLVRAMIENSLAVGSTEPMAEEERCYDTC